VLLCCCNVVLQLPKSIAHGAERIALLELLEFIGSVGLTRAKYLGLGTG
jgi:hypothetical protein